MLENIIIAIMVAICAFFIGRKMYSQFKGTASGCGCSCTECDSKKTPDSSNKESNQQNFPMHENGCNCPSANGKE